MKCTYQMTDGVERTFKFEDDLYYAVSEFGIATASKDIAKTFTSKPCLIAIEETWRWQCGDQIFPFSPLRMDFSSLKAFTYFLVYHETHWKKYGINVNEATMCDSLLQHLHFTNEWMWSKSLSTLLNNVKNFRSLHEFISDVTYRLYRKEDPGLAIAFKIKPPEPPKQGFSSVCAPKPLLSIQPVMTWNPPSNTISQPKQSPAKSKSKKAPKLPDPPKPSGIRKFKFDRDL